MERIEHAIDINAPLHATYMQCTRFSDYPRFMEGIDAVRMADERHLHWQASRNGEVIEWSSVITERDPDRYIAWHDVDGPHRTFTLNFSALDANRTRLAVAVTLPEESESGDRNSVQRGKLEQRLPGDLERLKKLMESGGHDWNEWPSTHDSNAASAHAVPVFDNFSEAALNTAESRSSSTASYSSSAAQQGGQHHEPGAASPSVGETGKKRVQGLLHGWDQPLSLVRKMSGEVDQLFGRLTGRTMGGKWGQGMAGRWIPVVDVIQRADEMVVSVDLPGVAKQDVYIEIQDNKLTIEGERREPNEQKSLPGYRRDERTYGSFYRQIALPAGIPPERMRATLLNGVLEIRMPLPPGLRSQGKRVDIEDSS